MRYIREEHIARSSFIYAIVIVLLVTFTTGGVLIAKKFNVLQKDLQLLEKELVEEQRQQLENDVLQQVDRIDSLRTSMAKRLEQQLSNKVLEIEKMAAQIYKRLKGKVSREELADTIVDAIRPARFYDKAGYFFIFSLDGEAILYPNDSNVEGKNLITDRVAINPDAVRGFIRLAVEKQQGFYSYDWEKPGEPGVELYAKVSFVSYFKELDWVIGTGEYYEHIDEIVKKSITTDLETSFIAKSNDYFFLYEIHNLEGGDQFATMAVNSNRPDLVGLKISDSYKDIKGKQFRKEFLKGIREKGEAVSVYWYKKPDGTGVGRKMAYFKYYPDWKWVVARGVYLDRLDAAIAVKKEKLRSKVKDDIALLCMIFLVAVVVALIVAYYYAQELQGIFTRYKQTQQEHLSSLEELNRVLEIKSNTDVLTKVYNRGYFNQQLALELARANRYQTPFSLMLLDIDKFKSINDNYGHLTGDRILQEIAALVQGQIRKNDLLARWGGEEFTVLIPGVAKTQGYEFAEKLRKKIAEGHFSESLSVTCSIGVSEYLPGEEGDNLLKRVDKALYTAKESGRNKTVMM